METEYPCLFRVILPIRGSYSQIRHFMGAILKDMPIASVDALRFERKKVGETPLTLEIPKGTARKVELAKGGMKTERRAVVGDRDRTEHVVMKEKPAGSSGSKPGADFDADGALAPSWMR